MRDACDWTRPGPTSCLSVLSIYVDYIDQRFYAQKQIRTLGFARENNLL